MATCLNTGGNSSDKKNSGDVNTPWINKLGTVLEYIKGSVCSVLIPGSFLLGTPL